MVNLPWQFYLNSQDAWDAMYASCDAAKSSIDFEQFIFQNDSVGQRFADLFIKKVTEGVKVRFLCDTAGSYFFYHSSLAQKLRQNGVGMIFFNEISPWKLGKFNIWFARDHRKLLVIDRETAFVGGVGMSERFKLWRDTHMKLSGPVVYELQTAFDHMWWMGKREKFTRFKAPRQLDDTFTVLTNAPHFRQRFINRTLLDIIREAKRSVYITTPYFVPDARFFRVLRLAARRGVDVRILLPKNSDHPFVDFASHYYFAKLLKVGGKIFQYITPMIHAKTIVVDGDWASVGSANIDNLSSFFNYEILVTSHNNKFVSEVKEHFMRDLANTEEVSSLKWEKRSFLQKVFELACIPFASFF